MPPLPAVPNVIKMVLKGVSGEATPISWANILHWAITGTSSIPALTALSDAVDSSWSTHMSPRQVNNVELTGVETVDLTSATSPSLDLPYATPGTRGDDEIPASTAFLCDYPITRRYRGGHPRTYLIVGGNADFLDAAHWSAAFTTEVADAFALFLSDILGFSSSGMTVANLVNVSYVSKEENPVPPYRRAVPIVDVIAFASFTAQQQMATQRRRVGRKRA